MFIRFFKARYFGQFAALFLLAVVLWIDIIIDPSAIAPDGDSSNFFGLTGLLQKYPVILVVFSILLLLFQAILLNQILENHRLMERHQLLTAAMYVVIMSSSPVLTNPVGMLLTNFILILQLNIVLNIYGKKEPYREVFDAAFLIGIASLIHFPVVIFIVFLWTCLVLYQIFTGREWLISIVGILIPHLFAGTYFYITGQIETGINKLITFFTQIQPPEFTESIYLYITWGFLAVLAIISLGQFSRGLTENTISLRKKFRTIVIFFIISLVSAIFSEETLMLHLVIIAIPVSAFIALYLSKTKKPFIPEIILLLLLISILMGKYFNLS
jgi:hypothetical protein